MFIFIGWNILFIYFSFILFFILFFFPFICLVMGFFFFICFISLFFRCLCDVDPGKEDFLKSFFCFLFLFLETLELVKKKMKINKKRIKKKKEISKPFLNMRNGWRQNAMHPFFEQFFSFISWLTIQLR